MKFKNVLIISDIEEGRILYASLTKNKVKKTEKIYNCSLLD